MSTWKLPGGKGWQARKADNLTAISEADYLENVKASASYNPMAPISLAKINLFHGVPYSLKLKIAF
jgi:hypothetical protein